MIPLENESEESNTTEHSVTSHDSYENDDQGAQLLRDLMAKKNKEYEQNHYAHYSKTYIDGCEECEERIISESISHLFDPDAVPKYTPEQFAAAWDKHEKKLFPQLQDIQDTTDGYTYAKRKSSKTLNDRMFSEAVSRKKTASDTNTQLDGIRKNSVIPQVKSDPFPDLPLRSNTRFFVLPVGVFAGIVTPTLILLGDTSSLGGLTMGFSVGAFLALLFKSLFLSPASKLNKWLYEEYGLVFNITRRSLNKEFARNRSAGEESTLCFENEKGDVLLLTLYRNYVVESRVYIQSVIPQIPDSVSDALLAVSDSDVPSMVQDIITEIRTLSASLVGKSLLDEERYICERVSSDVKEILSLYADSPKTPEAVNLLVSTMNGLVAELETIVSAVADRGLKSMRVFDAYVKDRKAQYRLNSEEGT